MKLSSKCVRQSSKCERPNYYMVSPETRTRCDQQQNGVAVGKNGRFMVVFDGTMSIPVQYSKTRVREVPLEEPDKSVFEGSSNSGNRAHGRRYYRNGNRAQGRRYYKNGKEDAHVDPLLDFDAHGDQREHFRRIKADSENKGIGGFMNEESTMGVQPKKVATPTNSKRCLLSSELSLTYCSEKSKLLTSWDTDHSLNRDSNESGDEYSWKRIKVKYDSNKVYDQKKKN